MGIYLYLVETDFWTYDKSNINDNEVIFYKFKSIDEALKVGDFFKKSGINDLCDTFVGPYDVDFFNVDKCKILKKWISNNEDIIKKAELEEIFTVIDNYCSEAIKFKTGIEIEC